MYNSKRGTTNVVATMLIFIIMIASMGVLYSRISPTIFGFEANTQANNQEFVMFSVANAVTDLVSSGEDSQNRVKIISKDATYSVNSGHSLNIQFFENGGVTTLLDDVSTNPIENTTSIGSFTANVSAKFQGRSGTNYFGKNFDEDTFINQNSTDIFNFVSKVEYINNEARFSLYFRSRVHVSDRLPNGEYDISIIVIKIIFNSGFVDFPVSLDEWSLRLRRSASVITSFTKTNVLGDIRITQTVDGVVKSNIDLLNLTGSTVNVRFIEVPILFTV